MKNAMIILFVVAVGILGFFGYSQTVALRQQRQQVQELAAKLGSHSKPALVTSQQEVEHALSVGQCRADLKAWWEKAGRNNGLDDIGYDALGSMSSEMTSCMFVDKSYRSSALNAPDYHELVGELDAQKAERVDRFLIRHDLRQQFIEEDAAGERQ